MKFIFKMKFLWWILILISLSASQIRERSSFHYVVVWNVGQGQWVTAVDDFTCQHFDMGGEVFPFRQATALCREKQNELFLSHWDWDHIGGIAKWKLDHTCIMLAPLGPSSDHKEKLLAKFPTCQKRTALKHWDEGRGKDANSLSHVVEYKNFLMPGDSPKTQEKSWDQVQWITKTRVLVLGHHGSRTSTSEELIERLPLLKMAIASARWSRYHHPHAETIALLKKHHIALLKTENWGSIWFEL